MEIPVPIIDMSQRLLVFLMQIVSSLEFRFNLCNKELKHGMKITKGLVQSTLSQHFQGGSPALRFILFKLSKNIWSYPVTFLFNIN